MPAAPRVLDRVANRWSANIKRMEELERLPVDSQGSKQAFAIQAGRELRVIASAKETDDALAAKICRDIAQAFEQQLTYPAKSKLRWSAKPALPS